MNSTEAEPAADLLDRLVKSARDSLRLVTLCDSLLDHVAELRVDIALAIAEGEEQ